MNFEPPLELCRGRSAREIARLKTVLSPVHIDSIRINGRKIRPAAPFLLSEIFHPAKLFGSRNININPANAQCITCVEMHRLNPKKLHVRYSPPTSEEDPIHPRCYTLTHSDRTGDLFLTIGPEYDKKQIRGLYTRLMRDEVVADWRRGDGGYELHVHCEVGRGLGSAKMRENIFRRELDLVMEAFRYGDREFFEKHPFLDSARILVHFHARKKMNDMVEDWGRPEDYS